MKWNNSGSSKCPSSTQVQTDEKKSGRIRIKASQLSMPFPILEEYAGPSSKCSRPPSAAITQC